MSRHDAVGETFTDERPVRQHLDITVSCLRDIHEAEV